MGGRSGSRSIARVALGARAIAGCGARPAAGPPVPAGDEIALYRDRAVVAQRVELDAPRAGPVTRALRLPAGVDPGAVQVLDRGGLAAVELRAAVAVELAATAPRPGRFTVTLGYATDHLAWDATYTMTTNSARDRATVRGAIAIRNTTGLALRARTWVIDTELGALRDGGPEQLRAALRGAPAAARDAAPRELGLLALGDGEIRIELLDADPPHRLRSVLVYDPIGAGLDHTGAVPVADPAIGASHAPGQVSESFEIARDPAASRGLPAGPARLLEGRPDGSTERLGEARLFDATSRVADVDTVAVGTARGVTGHRERRDFARDDELRRFSEEFLITIDNARPYPIDIVLREHLYRGQNWTLAYQSVPAVKEGPQQIALRTRVPASGQAKVLYVVVYTW
ncbi:MAG TPA: hypothetical protein VHW23_22930 [Kofleriaceae bacterium]|nr:hypothetical protein [Kofleriaceae bacterium]